MPVLTMYDQILTPKGYRYPFTLRLGTPVWTRSARGFITVPFSFDLTKERAVVDDWYDVSWVQKWTKRWLDPSIQRRVTLPCGSTGCSGRVHKLNLVHAEHGPKKARKLEAGDSIVIVPYFDLSDRVIQDQYESPEDAAYQMKRRAARPPMESGNHREFIGHSGYNWPDVLPDDNPTITRKAPCSSIKSLAPRKHLELIRVHHPVIHNGLILS